MVSTRGVLIIGNWKMYPATLEAARIHIRRSERIVRTSRIKVVMCPPALFVADIARAVAQKKNIQIGVQNIHTESDGAYTGEVSAQQAYSVGARYAIVGHAERRVTGETNSATGKKVFMALTTGLTPVLCVGEKSRDAQGDFLKEVAQQITDGLALVPQAQRNKVIIAYEPVYAIGAPKPPAEADIHQMILLIKKTLTQNYSASVARGVPVLYGGAVDAQSVPALLKNIPEIQGFLVGRASVDSEKFAQLLEALL